MRLARLRHAIEGDGWSDDLGTDVFCEQTQATFIVGTCMDVTMEKNRVKKMGALASAAVFIVFFILIVALYLIAKAPISIILVVSVVYLIIAAILIYHVMQRFKEIDGGIDDAVDDY